MFTVCPKCALTLVVTAADLRVAQGYVRCGRCSSVFNALAQLSDERGAARAAEPPLPEPEPEPEAQPEPEPPPPPPPSPARTAAPPPAAEEEGLPEEALEFNPERTDAASVFVAAPPNPEWTAATGSFKALVAANQEPVTPTPAAANEDLDIELDAALLSQIVESEPRAPRAPPPPAPPAAPAPAPEKTPAPPRRAAPRPAPAAEPAAAAPAGPQPDLEPDTEPDPLAGAAPSRASWLWSGAALLALLVLVAQAVNHQRDALATDPRFGAPLTALYAALGVPLMPRWDLHAYDVRQLGATVAPAAAAGATGAITVRASIHNAGSKPQPLPLLRVTLQDRFGNRIASRDVAPRDYLPHGMAPGTPLGVGQRIDAELAFVDPGSSAVGFELDACLAMRGGVACANDTSAR